MRAVVLIVYGVGGHKDEAERLMAKLAMASKKTIDFVALCEDGVKPNSSVLETVFVPEFRSKDQKPLRSIPEMVKCSLKVFRQIQQLRKRFDIKLVISTGPGLAIPCFFWCKLMGIKTLFVESWCRFYQRSFSGNVCRFLSDRFYYQNESMASLYPKGRWSGRL